MESVAYFATGQVLGLPLLQQSPFSSRQATTFSSTHYAVQFAILLLTRV